MFALATFRTALALAASLGVSAAAIPSAEAAPIRAKLVAAKFVKQTLIAHRPGLGAKIVHKNVSFVPPGCFVQRVKKWKTGEVLKRIICK